MNITDNMPVSIFEWEEVNPNRFDREVKVLTNKTRKADF